MKISVITPIYNEVESIDECKNLIKKLMQNKNLDYEHIFVDNSSNDGSSEKLKKICENDEKIKLIINNQNYGILPSVFNALKHCVSNYTVVSFAADLQDPIDFLDKAIEKIKKDKKIEIVYAIRNQREENAILGLVKKTYYLIAKILTKNVLKPNVNIYQLIKDNVRQEIIQNQSNNPFIPYLLQGTTFNKFGIETRWKKRKYNVPKNNFFSLFDEAINAISNYSGFGSKICFMLSFFNIFFCFFFLIYNMVGLFFSNLKIFSSGIPSIIIFNCLMFGTLFFIIGILSENINHLLQIKIGKKVSIKEKINF